MAVSGSIDRRISEIAARQRGRAARRQLLAAGIGAGVIRRRLARGDLIDRGNCVYAQPPLIAGDWIRETEALLAARDGAALSHLTALSLWKMAPAPAPPVVHVVLAGAPTARRRDVRVHRVGTLEPRDVRLREGLPVAAPSLSLIQSASLITPQELASAFDAGAGRGSTNLGELEATLARYGPRHGAPAVRALIGEYRAFSYTRSRAERLLLTLLGQAGFATPLTNVPCHGFEVDALWPALGVVVEVDGFAYHGDRAAFERDRRRDQVLTAAGFTVTRVTWRQLTREPIAAMVRLGQILANAGQSRPPHG